jgi:salicylate hydroxylase
LPSSTTKDPIPITIFESAAQFGEIGADVDFQPYLVRVMTRNSPKIKEGLSTLLLS